MKALFDSTSFKISKLITNAYSTSFSIGTMLLQANIRSHIYTIYGFVRYADEIVDSFHDYDKGYLIKKFRNDTYEAIEHKISLNPILNSFQATVNTFGIERSIIDSFLDSMEMDLKKSDHDLLSYKKYIYGSAEVVGLMCLRVFTEGNNAMYEHLKKPALALGAAFQKVNFLRDLRHDSMNLGRTYFPEIQDQRFDNYTKNLIEKDIRKDFEEALAGIKQLPRSSRLGVYVAYVYYMNLFKKIEQYTPEQVMQQRIRIPDTQKVYLLAQSYFQHSFNLSWSK
ncbi:MAG: phytoene/squalene synthase family protein [Bacteroidota bacterium]|nr:phytoene/squalene synthase family protein [Bacteroidota bacterium]